MYEAYLSYTQLKKYISLLTESVLLEYQPHNQKYITTEKGMRFIQIYNQLTKIGSTIDTVQ